VKRITAIEAPRCIAFEIVEQELGIESCIVAKSGSYAIRRTRHATEVLLTTNYQSHLHPRSLFRPFERLAIHQLHRYILNGMRHAIALPLEESCATPAECPSPVSAYHLQNAYPKTYRGEEVCTMSPSPSRRSS